MEFKHSVEQYEVSFEIPGRLAVHDLGMQQFGRCSQGINQRYASSKSCSLYRQSWLRY